MTAEEKQVFIDRIAAEIGEHFDAVQILAHDSDSDSYTTFSAGVGSLFAREYQAMTWSQDRQEETVEEEDDESQ
jgi:hypothetical protein